VRRVSVVGTSGSGKSWLASRLATKLAARHLELDGLRHQPGWQSLPDTQFVEQVRHFVRDHQCWVVDGNYFSLVTGPVVWPLADTVIWIDLPKPVVVRQVAWRTVKRGVLRQQLWNGNRERVRDILRWDPDKSIVRWSWTSHGPLRERYAAAMTDTAWQHLEFVRLTSSRDMRGFLDRIEPRVGRQ
jgi:adenylate kinase family enzyme